MSTNGLALGSHAITATYANAQGSYTGSAATMTQVIQQ
jgi:hypothetical protein